MRLGVIFPQLEIGAEPKGVREYAQAAEELGYHHLAAYDHVVGASRAGHPGFSGPYDHTCVFHEPFVLFGFLAGLTKTIEFVSEILILPQRQTVLVAKQAAEVDVLSGGRMRLGIGVGWNEVEYEALGMNFKDRGRRSEEQIEVLRALFSRDLVSFKGKWHTITEAGLNPMPVRRLIPIWMGGGSSRGRTTSKDAVALRSEAKTDEVMRRIARLADGWFPMVGPNIDGAAEMQRMLGFVREAGRDPKTFGIQGRISVKDHKTEADWKAMAARWASWGASDIAVETMGAGLKTPRDHIEVIKRFKAVVGG
ncbi:MAG: LLM class F420-dependent oxidoreductase [Rhodospirillales bacterium]|nr:LLM class F420-dependent oxidoreductase [Rhodospirillales bacterium]